MKLKKIYILLSLSLAGMTTFSACQDFLSEKPYSFVGPEEVGNDDAAVSQWVTGVYSKWADDMFRWGNFPACLIWTVTMLPALTGHSAMQVPAIIREMM